MPGGPVNQSTSGVWHRRRRSLILGFQLNPIATTDTNYPCMVVFRRLKTEFLSISPKVQEAGNTPTGSLLKTARELVKERLWFHIS
jgi:hypothetical protein